MKLADRFFAQVLSSFGPMLMYHLDAEVETLRGDNLRRYYTLEEGPSSATLALS